MRVSNRQTGLFAALHALKSRRLQDRHGAAALALAGPTAAAGAEPPAAQAAAPLAVPWAMLLGGAAVSVLAFIAVLALRRRRSARQRPSGRRRHPYASIVSADWPPLTVFVAAHNDEAVIDDCLEHLMRLDYPADRLRVVPVNDHSSDRTQELIDAAAARHPGRIRPLHRSSSTRDRAASLREATALATTPFIVVLDADYLAPRGLLRRLMTPFFDPEVGAVIGRVVPHGLEPGRPARRPGAGRDDDWQVDAQTRLDLGRVPAWGDTIGAVRLAALRAVGGWPDDASGDDDGDLVRRLLRGGWQTVCHDGAERYRALSREHGSGIRCAPVSNVVAFVPRGRRAGWPRAGLATLRPTAGAVAA